MIIAGFFLKANAVRIVTLNGTREEHSVIAEKFNKLDLPKNPTQDDVEAFVHAFKAYCSDHNVNKIIINKRPTAGLGAGGAGTFIIEGILLSVAKIPLEFIHIATINATERRFNTQKTSKPNTADLGKAYDFAFEGLV